MSTRSPCFHIHVIGGLLFIISLLADLSHGDIGTASSYSPPYVPTECYGYDTSQFPKDKLFAAAGEEIWDGGAACGRLYLVRCIGAQLAGGCIEGAAIEIMIVNYAGATSAATMRLSETAYGRIASNGRMGGGTIIIEFQQYVS
ncbi:EG45-like domain containing protein-like protein [Drosera capensis]